MTYGSLIDYESQKIKKTVLSATVAELYSFMMCFGSCQFLRGLWMDISSEVANIHMRTDAKNLVTTAKTIHLLRKEACSGSIHDLAHIPTQNCLADCLTKASAKADNLITAVQTGKLLELDVDIHPDFRNLMEHKVFLSTLCKTFLHTREKEVYFLNTLKISLAPILQEELFQVMIEGTQQQKEQKKLNTRERKGQDATKITSAPAESYIQCLWSIMPISMTARTWMKNNSNQTTIEDFTEILDEAGFVRQYNSCHLLMRMLCMCLALMNLLLSVASPSSSFVTMAVSIPHWDVKLDFLSQVRASPVWISIRGFLFSA